MKLETPRYNIALNETLGSIHCGGVPMSIAVQTDMATPALARWHLIKLNIITNTLESVLKWQFLSSLSCYFVADVAVVGCGVVDLDPSQRFGSHELKKDFLEPSVLGDKVQSTLILM